jgi:hypothetical protein
MVRVNEISEELEFCSACKTGYLRPTGEVVAKVESAGGFADIGTRRVFKCDNCKQRHAAIRCSCQGDCTIRIECGGI